VGGAPGTGSDQSQAFFFPQSIPKLTGMSPHAPFYTVPVCEFFSVFEIQALNAHVNVIFIKILAVLLATRW
jgi:hypothetical protein